MSMNAYEFVELIAREIPRSNLTADATMTSKIEFNQDFKNFIPLIVFGALLLIVMIIVVAFRISKSLEKTTDNDDPPSYLDVVVPAPSFEQISGNFSAGQSGSLSPPSYTEILKDPPTYAFVNAAFECDPPKYSEIDENFQIVVHTQSTTVFA